MRGRELRPYAWEEVEVVVQLDDLAWDLELVDVAKAYPLHPRRLGHPAVRRQPLLDQREVFLPGLIRRQARHR
jgi:hypothetical protein